MVADRHNVEPDGVHELGRSRAFVGGVEKRALELVTGIDHENVLAFAFKGGAALVDLGLDPGDTAEAFAFGFGFRITGRIVFVDRFNARMQIIDMQHRQGIVGEGGAGNQSSHRQCGDA